MVFFNPSITTCHLLYMANATPRNATGHGRERGGLTLSLLLPVFSTPPSLRATSPIAHTCAEEEVNAFLLNCLCSCFDFGATSRDAVGKKCKIYLSTPNGEYPLTPSPIPCGIVGHSHTPPLCFATQNIGEVARSAGGVRKYRQR